MTTLTFNPFGTSTSVNTSVDAELLSENKSTQHTTLNYCQIVSPPNQSLEKTAKHKDPWGLFISIEQADAVGFTPNKNWTQTTVEFNPDKPIAVDGYISRIVSLCFLRRSQIEVEKATDNGWTYLGLAYKKGSITEEGKLGNSDYKLYRFRTRNIVLIMDYETKTPLHTLPLSLGFARGVGAGVGAALNDFYRQTDAALAKAAGVKPTSYNGLVHALSIFNFVLTPTKNEGKAPFIAPSMYLVPPSEKINGSSVINQGGRSVELKTVPLSSLFIDKKSETGETISSFYDCFEYFESREPEQEKEAIEVVDSLPSDLDNLPF